MASSCPCNGDVIAPLARWRHHTELRPPVSTGYVPSTLSNKDYRGSLLSNITITLPRCCHSSSSPPFSLQLPASVATSAKLQFRSDCLDGGGGEKGTPCLIHQQDSVPPLDAAAPGIGHYSIYFGNTHLPRKSGIERSGQEHLIVICIEKEQ